LSQNDRDFRRVSSRRGGGAVFVLLVGLMLLLVAAGFSEGGSTQVDGGAVIGRVNTKTLFDCPMIAYFPFRIDRKAYSTTVVLAVA
jgi:hypothetical protein